MAALSSFHFPDGVRLTTYAVVYLFSRYSALTADTRRHPPNVRVGDRPTFFLPLAARDDTATRATKYLTTRISFLLALFSPFPIRSRPSLLLLAS